jgi:hypothetical protein
LKEAHGKERMQAKSKRSYEVYLLNIKSRIISAIALGHEIFHLSADYAVYFR